MRAEPHSRSLIVGFEFELSRAAVLRQFTEDEIQIVDAALALCEELLSADPRFDYEIQEARNCFVSVILDRFRAGEGDISQLARQAVGQFRDELQKANQPAG